MKASKKIPGTETEDEKPIVITPPNKLGKLPVKFVTTDMTIDLAYLENTTLITEVKFSNGIRYLITYADKIPKKLQKFKDNVNIQSADYLVTNGLVSRVARFEVREKVTTPTEKYYLEYNALSQINKIKTHAVTNALLSEEAFEYSSTGNRYSATHSAAGLINYYTYKFDTKNAIFKSASFSQLLRIEINEDIMNQGVSNILEVSNAKVSKENIEYNYTYGVDDYPTEFKIKKESITKSYKVTYVALKD
jgi:hypothetical protein